jgi:hypothetical protein
MVFAFQVAIYILWVTEKLKIRSVSSWLESDKIFNILLTMEDSFVLLSGCSLSSRCKKITFYQIRFKI